MSTAIDRRDGAIRTRNRPAVPGAPFIPELDKAQPGGVATLDGSTSLIPTSQLGTGVADATTALFGDQTFKAAATAAALTTETNNRIAADNAEAVTRAAADTTLQTNITNEATARANADALLLVKANNLSDLASPGTARTNLGLGTSATENVGAVANTVCAGDDARLTNSRAPNGAAGGQLSGTYPNPSLSPPAYGAFVPALTGGGTLVPTLTATTTAKYLNLGKLLILELQLVFTVATSNSPNVNLALPAGLVAKNDVFCKVLLADGGGTVAEGYAHIIAGATTITFTKVSGANWTNGAGATLHGVLLLEVQ